MLSEKQRGFMRIECLFNSSFKKVTCLLLVVWHCGTMIYFGFFMILAVAMSVGNGKDAIFLGWTISGCIMIPFYYITILMLENPYLGSRKVLVICFALLIGAELSGVFLVGSQAFYVSVVALTGLGIMGYNSLYAFTNEVYPPDIKSTSLGFFTFITALTGISTSYIIF